MLCPPTLGLIVQERALRFFIGHRLLCVKYRRWKRPGNKGNGHHCAPCVQVETVHMQESSSYCAKELSIWSHNSNKKTRLSSYHTGLALMVRIINGIASLLILRSCIYCVIRSGSTVTCKHFNVCVWSIVITSMHKYAISSQPIHFFPYLVHVATPDSLVLLIGQASLPFRTMPQILFSFHGYLGALFI